MKKIYFGKNKKEEYNKKSKKISSNLDQKLKILSGATPVSVEPQKKISPKKTNIKKEVIHSKKQDIPRRNNDIVDEITKDSLKSEEVLDSFSKDLNHVFSNISMGKKIKPKKTNKNSFKESFANFKNSTKDMIKGFGKKEPVKFENKKLDENLSKLRININQFDNAKNVKPKEDTTTIQKKKYSKIKETKKKPKKEELPDYEVIPEISSINRKRAQSIQEAFKEIQDIKNGKTNAEKYVKYDKYAIKTPDYYRRIRRRFSIAGAIVGCLFITLFYTSISSNYILATGEEEKKAIAEFEPNSSPINTMNIIAGNISDYTKKEITTEEITIEYETKYMDNDQMPSGETKIIQTGSFGYKDRTIIRTYENETLIDEKIINEVLKTPSIDEVIDVGKSDFLAEKKAHIEEVVYTTEEIPLRENASNDSREKCIIYQYVPVTLLYVMSNNWCIVSVDGMEGYIDGQFITTEAATPGITEKVRVQALMLSLNIDMPLNRPSGLTESDFIRVLSNNYDDENNIFSNNARKFYEIENKYKINGIFLAAIGIHESNWGRSTISQRKKNLFGYGAYDDSPFASSYTFDSYEYGIELVAKVLVKYYLNEEGTSIYDGERAVATYYNGPTVNGVGQRYASDPDWGQKVFNTMNYLYNRIK